MVCRRQIRCLPLEALGIPRSSSLLNKEATIRDEDDPVETVQEFVVKLGGRSLHTPTCPPLPEGGGAVAFQRQRIQGTIRVPVELIILEV